MNSDVIVVLLYIVGVLVITSVIMIVNNRKMRRIFRRRCIRQWGEMPEGEYTADRLDKIGMYARRKSTEADFYVDDITWNDLDMSRLFLMMNNTACAPGEEYLYYLLRTPVMKERVLKERKKLMDFFTEEEDKRQQLQLILADVGKLQTTSVAEALDNLKTAPRVNKATHLTLLAMLGFSILLTFAYPFAGLGLLFIVCGVNIVSHTFSEDSKTVQVYVGCFQCILRMAAAARTIEKLPWEEISTQQEQMSRGRKGLKSFMRGSRLLSGKTGMNDGLEAILLDLVRMLTHIDMLQYNRMLGEIEKHEKDVELILEGIGELDAMLAAASFTQMLPLHCTPEFAEKEMILQVDNLYHPYIEEPVANSIEATGGILVTGSNASGKSTFLKNVALNSLLAQTIYLCTASYYRAPILKVMTSMALSDDLASGESYFIVEIKSVKRILDQADQGEPLLCIIDEVLRGTNTIERIAASSRILRALSERKVLCFAATHDVELSYILEDSYSNYHFEEEITESDVIFNYILKPGPTKTRNAIQLLEVLGYDREIVSQAREAARDFEEHGSWKKIDGGVTA